MNLALDWVQNPARPGKGYFEGEHVAANCNVLSDKFVHRCKGNKM